MPKPKRDPYEVLGVSRDASQEQIKRAYKRKARRAHPDAGGSPDDFNELNLAHQVLGNPARRALYDATGETSRPPVESEVRNILLQAFSQALANDAKHCLNFAYELIKNQRQQMEAQLKHGQKELARFKKKRDLITVSGGDNVFQMIVDGSIKKTSEGIAMFEHNIELADLALKELKRYRSSEVEEVVQVVRFSFSVSDASTGTGW